jgi:hypothetical protein
MRGVVQAGSFQGKIERKKFVEQVFLGAIHLIPEVQGVQILSVSW